MKLMAMSMAMILAVGYLLGGRLRNVADLKLHWPLLALAGLALQFVTGPGDTVPLVCLYLSFALLIVFTVKNIRVDRLPADPRGRDLQPAGDRHQRRHAGLEARAGRVGSGAVPRGPREQPVPEAPPGHRRRRLRFLGDVIPRPHADRAGDQPRRHPHVRRRRARDRRRDALDVGRGARTRRRPERELRMSAAEDGPCTAARARERRVGGGARSPRRRAARWRLQHLRACRRRPDHRATSSWSIMPETRADFTAGLGRSSSGSRRSRLWT